MMTSRVLLRLMPMTFTLISALLHSSCLVSALPPSPAAASSSDGFSLVPALRISPISSKAATVLSAKTMHRLHALDAGLLNVQPIHIPIGQYRDASEAVRNQLQERFETNHLLYLGSSSSGHYYAFPLMEERNEALRAATGAQQLKMALLSVQPRPPHDNIYRDRTIDCHGLLGIHVENKNIFYQQLMGAYGGTNGLFPVTHDLRSLFANRIHMF